MIQELTSKQDALIPIIRDRWLKIGLNTDPLDFEAAKTAAIAAYKAADLRPPVLFFRFQSPFSAAIGALILSACIQSKDQVWDQVGDQVRDQVWDQVWDQVRDQVWDQVWDQVGDQVWGQVRGQVWGQVGGQVGGQVRDQVRGQVWDQVWVQVGPQVWIQVWGQVGDQVGDQVRDQVGDQVWDQVWDQVGDQVRDQVWDQVGGQVGDQVWGQVWDQVGDQVRDQVWDQVGPQVWDQVRGQVGGMLFGAHDASFLSFYDYFRRIGVESCSKFMPLMDMARACGWWAPYKGYAVFQDRPQKIRFDDQNRLHCEDGPAILYRDGFSVYAWHGVRIPGDWIENGISVKQAFRIENLEKRQAAFEVVGWENVVNKLNPNIIDSDHPEIGQLLEVEIPDFGPAKFLKVLCGTKRSFVLRVPLEMTTARQANAWTYGLEEEEYAPEKRS